MKPDKLTPEQLKQLRQIDFSKLEGYTVAEDDLTQRYGAKGTPSRDDFEAKARAWYYGEILRERRKELHLTQKELADRIGRDRQYINRIEKGETDIQLSTFIRISEALGIRLRMDICLT